ncbi:V-type ATP synthase subunit I [Candidatus Micrarchaeota archaeon]|nr:V-type ATP synthase subunit I [Candidatus Micrarchaeota archaeon]
MSKVRVTCSSASVEKLVKELYDFGMIHVKKSKQLGEGKPLTSFNDVSSALISLRAIEREYAIKTKIEGKELPLNELSKRLESLELSFLDDSKKRIQELESNISSFKERLKELDLFKEIDFNLPESELVEYACFDFKKDFTLKNASVYKFGSYALIAFPKKDRDKVFSSLKGVALRFVNIPRIEKTFSQDYSDVQKQLDYASRELKDLKTELSGFLEKNSSEIVFLRKSFELLARKSELPLKFGFTESLCSVEGWVLEKDYSHLKHSVEKEFSNKVLVEKIDSNDLPPSEYNNPTLARPFESFMSFLSVPRFDELDPSIFVALTFPLFFGMILGDIGYGLILVLMGLAIRWKAKDKFVSDAGGILTYSGVFTIIFGFFYFEFFGFEEVFGFHIEPFIHRADPHGVQELLALSVLFGFLHLALGFILAIWNNYKHHHYKHALAKGGWLLLSISMVFLISQSIDIVFFESIKHYAEVFGPELALYGTLIGLGVLLYTEGVIGLFEIPGYFSNLLSYMRIAALGLAGVIIAGLVNQLKPDLALVASLDPLAIVMFVLTLIFFLIGHVVSLSLGIFESGIQSLRLHAVEFFSKFYKGGAESFSPLKRK